MERISATHQKSRRGLIFPRPRRWRWQILSSIVVKSDRREGQTRIKNVETEIWSMIDEGGGERRGKSHQKSEARDSVTKGNGPCASGSRLCATPIVIVPASESRSFIGLAVTLCELYADALITV